MNTYFEVVATYDGVTEIMFGSFIRSECKYEIDAERASWKADGYKQIKITSRPTNETPDGGVYEDNIVSSHELFMQQAPAFNFESSEEQILAKALEKGFVVKIEGKEDAYLIDSNY